MLPIYKFELVLSLEIVWVLHCMVVYERIEVIDPHQKLD